ncbi:MAG: hypothetical protein GXO77_08360 [Calditrichaeota bacterium]|nr:hypothetical protein [Calditrichota bacterium]
MKIRILPVVLLLVTLIFTQQGAGMTYQKISLNGQWQIEPGKEMPERFNYLIPVPALADAAEPELSWQDYEYFWYRKEFELGRETDFRNIYLQLEQVKYGTQVWLNGKLVGGDIPCYTSQEFDLTPFIKRKGSNVLLIRVGVKSTLPKESAVGNDFEKVSFIPGIWGDVWLHLYGQSRFQWTRIIPDIQNGSVQIHSELQNFSSRPQQTDVRYVVREKKSGRVVNSFEEKNVLLKTDRETILETNIPVKDFRLWSPEHPFLYVLEATIAAGGKIAHRQIIPFGMRRFEIRKGDFYLNGKRRVLFGSNIAFHRMLSDQTRGTLPWNAQWIKKALVDIPKAHNMFFFRFHLGHAYNRWYDLADEYGIMLQDEWMSWQISGSAEQIRKEFTQWVKENINHPSIVIWDPLNESENKEVTEKIVPDLKKIDPTRPWEIVDFNEDHPYIYSLGPVLNKKKFGFSRSITDLRDSPSPTMVNEYLWWWLDQDGNPTPLTQIVLERWLGANPSKDAILRHQSFLARELTELWRRLDLDAIMPFVYLSLRGGATGNWFFGDLADLKPKPILKALKNAFSPLGVSVELWDRHFLTSEKREIAVYLFNDDQSDRQFNLRLKFGNQPDYFYRQLHFLKEGERKVVKAIVGFPSVSGADTLVAEIVDLNGKKIADSRKPVFVFEPIKPPKKDDISDLVIHDPSDEVRNLLTKNQIVFRDFKEGFESAKIVFVNAGGPDKDFFSRKAELTRFVRWGGVLIVQEPSFGVSGEKEIPLLDELSLHIQFRKDPDRGGYDSYVFPTNPRHRLWKDIESRHLQFFNGGFGGEIVSQYNAHPSLPYHAAAVCHLSLTVPAVLEIPYGDGWVIVSRLQIRGRLNAGEKESGLFDRRYDPVAERYFWNLLLAYADNRSYHQKIKNILDKQPVYISRVRVSSGDAYPAVDGKMSTRWSSDASDPQWLWLDFGKPTELQKMIIHWETAYGKEYKILISDDDQNWRTVFWEKNSDGREDEIDLNGVKARYLKIDCLRRGTQWGYSIWEVEFK